MKTYNLEVRLSKQEDGLWRAEVPALGGCWVDAPTLRQALYDVQEVAAMVIDLSIEREEPLPETIAPVGGVHVATVPLVLGEYSFKRTASPPRSRSRIR
jgi:predicted RNase H-like HicB family nuclease